MIYHVNMRDASSIALMQLFQMQKGDVLYASNAPLVDSAKLLTVFQKSVPTAAYAASRRRQLTNEALQKL